MATDPVHGSASRNSADTSDDLPDHQPGNTAANTGATGNTGKSCNQWANSLTD